MPSQGLEDNPNPNSLMQFASYVAADLQISFEFGNGLGVDKVIDKNHKTMASAIIFCF